MKTKLPLSTILAAVGVLLFFPASGVAADALALSDPGFENGLSEWDTQDDNGMSKAVAEAAHTGKFGLRVTDESEEAGSSVASRKIPITGGKTYEVRFWARIVSGAGIGVYLRFQNANGKIIPPAGEDEKNATRPPAVEVGKDQANWQQMSGKKTAPAEAVAMVIYIHSYSKHKVTADFDDFAVAETAK